MRAIVPIVLTLSIHAFGVHAQTLPSPPHTWLTRHAHGHSQLTRPASSVSSSAVGSAATKTAVPLQSASSVITPAPCPEAQATCGYVSVPLDRTQPNGKMIGIYFELYPHTGPGPARSAILMNLGGPGVSTTDARDFAQFLFASNLDTHDLLLVDDRGSGLSDTIDCPALQNGTAAFDAAELACAAQLGDAASRYGSGDIAQDMEAVRAALGYDQIDYFGASYGGADVTAYATRFGSHLRSIVLDAAVGAPAINEFVRLQFRTHSDPRMIRLDCQRSVLCSVDHPHPDAEFEELIDTVQRDPVEGDTHDAGGNPLHVRVDENALLNFVVTYPQFLFTNTGEILAAAAALKRGDSAPLLRLAAEGTFTLVGDSGDPTGYSAGDFYANACVDAEEPWDWADDIRERRQDYERAVRELPRNFFAPFSTSAPTRILFSNAGKQCLWWSKPTPSSPMVPPHAIYPRTPTLVLDGDLDNRVPLEETRQVAALFPHNTFVRVAEAGHETVGFSDCARSLVSEFIENRTVSDTSCAESAAIIFPAVGRFPHLARDARPAEINPHGANQIGIAERRVVAISVATAIDALQRSGIGPGTGVGLRGGTFQTTYGPAWVTTLTDCAFAADVSVSGTLTWAADNSVVADLTVGGAGTVGGQLHVKGAWFVPGAIGQFEVTGSLGGKNVSVLVPEA